MNFTLSDILYVFGSCVGAGWFLLCLARMQSAWEKSQSQTAQLRAGVAIAARQLLRHIQELEGVDREIKVAETSAANATKAQAERRQAIAQKAPPPAPEIYVSAEFPTFRTDLAWIADYARDDSLGPLQPFERGPKSTLIWGANQQTATARARQIASDFKGYYVNGLRRFVEQSAP